MTERTTIQLPPDLLESAQRKAADEGRTLTALVEDGLRIVLTEKDSSLGRCVSIPASSAVGGTMPGIDITDTSALQEMDDLEYVERMKHFK